MNLNTKINRREFIKSAGIGLLLLSLFNPLQLFSQQKSTQQNTTQRGYGA